MPTVLIEPTEKSDAIPAGAVSWGITAVKADSSPYTGRHVVVCVLDTGIDLSHPAFQGVDFVHEDFSGDGIADVTGHGPIVREQFLDATLSAPGLEWREVYRRH